MPDLRRTAARDNAVGLLQHYFALAMGKKSTNQLSSDCRAEIESIVDCIITAAREGK